MQQSMPLPDTECISGTMDNCNTAEAPPILHRNLPPYLGRTHLVDNKLLHNPGRSMPIAWIQKDPMVAGVA
jgi:hypothetical protein